MRGRRPICSRRVTPIALAVALAHGLVSAQVAHDTTSADVLGDPNPFATGGQGDIGIRPFTSFMERLSSPASKIVVKVAGDNLAADGVTGTDVSVQLLDSKGARLTQDADVTIEVDGGARILLPGRTTSESGTDRGDIDRIQPGVQTTVKGGMFQFKLIAPFKPDTVNLRVSVKGTAEKVIVRYVPELRDMIAVGLLEAGIRSDKFDPSKIMPASESDGFDQQLRGFTRDFNGGKGLVAARAAVYLKGKVKGDYLLTLAYDSAKYTPNILFQDIDPNSFYPIYGDSSVVGVDAQSSGKLYVRIDSKLSYLLYGDYTTQDSNPARVLSQYSRSLTGAKAHYEEGNVIADAFVSQQTFRRVIDEFPGRGVSGPYSVSNPRGISGSEKIEIVVRDRYQPQVVLKLTSLTRYSDYEFEPFGGQVLFKAAVPTIDDQGNPVSIRITYEVDQGGDSYTVFGGDVNLRLSNSLTVGVAGAKDNNPIVPYEVTGANLQYTFSPNTVLQAELAHTSNTIDPTATGLATNTALAGMVGEFSGNAGRIEIRHSDDTLRLRGYVVKTDPGFYNPTAGISGGVTEYGASGAYKVNNKLTVNAEYIESENTIANTRRQAAQAGLDLIMTDRLIVGGGVRWAKQDALTLVSASLVPCGTTPSLTTAGGTTAGYGLGTQGNQQIDPATGQQVQCAVAAATGTVAQTDLDQTAFYAKASYRATDTVMLLGEIQKEVGGNNNLLYSVGADWRVADKTRVYGRYAHAQTWGGAYGLGVGEASGIFSVGIDTQYMQDGQIFSEYRLRDASSGREVQAALGLRNGWLLAEGLRLTTNVERVNGVTGDTTAAGAGLEYTASDLWKASGRLEWRQDPNTVNWLMTLAAARKLDNNWSLLARDYALVTQGRNALGIDTNQNRFQIGFAYRPVDTNNFDALGLYERKAYRNLSAGNDATLNIVSLRANYHPSRPWWVSARYGYKSVDELLIGNLRDRYSAQLVGARVTYDITNQWTLGALFSGLQGRDGAYSYAYGIEVGYVVADNLLATLGYNWRGFKEADLTSSGDYTNQGWIFGMRYKFDETVFRGSDPSVNKTINPTPMAAKP